MAISLKNTRGISVTNGVKILVYGDAGTGKTTLISTLPAPLVLSAEAGLLSLSRFDIPYIEVTDMASMEEAYQWICESEEAQQFQSICLDSISEIGEVVLASEKTRSKDPRKAYGEMQDQMGELIRAFRDLPGRNVYFSAKLEKNKDDLGRILFGPSMPGQKLGQQMPYFFDEVFALRAEHDADGNIQRALMTETDGQWNAKDRSGRLDAWEPADLGAIIAKISERTDAE